MFSRIVRRARAPLLKNWNEPFAHFVQHRPFYDAASIIAFAEAVGKPLVQVVQESPTTQAGLARVTELAAEKGIQKFADFSDESDQTKLKKIVRDARFQSRPKMMIDILPSRQQTKTKLLEKVVKLSQTDQALLMLSGPKSVGKSLIAYQVAAELNRRPGFQSVWMEAPPKEEAFKKRWLFEMGLPLSQRDDLSFEDFADILAGARSDIKVVDFAGHEGDFHGGTDLYVEKSVKTIVFVDAMRGDYDYMERLLWIAVRHSGFENMTYVLIASDATDSYRVATSFETRCKHFTIKPFDPLQMKEFVEVCLRDEGVSVDDATLDDIRDTVMKYTYQATNARDLVQASVENGTYDKTALVATGEKFADDFGMHVRTVMREQGWGRAEFAKFYEVVGSNTVIDEWEFEEQVGSPKLLIEKNFAYEEGNDLHLMPELVHAVQFLVGKKN